MIEWASRLNCYSPRNVPNSRASVSASSHIDAYQSNTDAPHISSQGLTSIFVSAAIKTADG